MYTINQVLYLKKSKPPAPSNNRNLKDITILANKTGTGAAAGGGMSEKAAGVKKYRRDNPGSKLANGRNDSSF